jgi:hypothetical protein
MAIPPSKPNPLHGKAPAAAPVAPPAAPMRVNIHGIPPQPNMAPAPVEIDKDVMNDATMAEVEAGKTALAAYSKRTQAEHEYGKKSIARLNRVTPRVNEESK